MATVMDKIYAELSVDYEGTVQDMERQRLLGKLELVEPQELSLQDLYSLAKEPNRLLLGEKAYVEPEVVE